jgi:hypothetical protein
MVTGPMAVIGRAKEPDIIPALVRYVEAKCLVAGVTTSQGIALASKSGISSYYRGIVRNVEEPYDPALPKANTRIPDVAKRDWSEFDKELQKASCFLLHLSEGLDDVARGHFLALRNDQGQWAINRALAGIHCAGLQAEDFETYAGLGGAMVWSPLSNTVLYGDTARVKDAKAHGVRLGLGSDWSPSGSKNLLGELKVAAIYSQALGSVFSAKDLLAMATRDAAAILGWSAILGSLEPGKRADLIAVSSTSKEDPYDALIHAKESDVDLVVIGGEPRFGEEKLMTAAGAKGETMKIAGRICILNFTDPDEHPIVAGVSLGSARDVLVSGLARIPELAKAPARRALGEGPEWTIVLDEQMDDPWPGHDPSPMRTADDIVRAAPLPLVPLELDPLTVADDSNFFDSLSKLTTLAQQPDLVKSLRALY